jgi:hypothetical protein
MKFGTLLDIRHFPPHQSESIGMLLVKIGRTVQKLIKKGVIGKNCSLAPEIEILKLLMNSFCFPCLLNQSM